MRRTLDEAKQKRPDISDLATEPGVKAAVDAAVGATGRLDVLVNNAGTFMMGPLEAAMAEAIEGLFATNVLGLSYTSRAALPHLRETPGTIINISSGLGHRPGPNMSYYAANKAAVDSLTRSWALELAHASIRVNALAPGSTDTPIFAKLGMSEEAVIGLKAQLKQWIPLERMGQPEKSARWALTLADPRTAWVTGQVIGVDGGSAL